MLTERQRALAAMRGEKVDRVPFVARMDLWYNYARNRGTLPEKYRGWSLWDIQRDLGIGIFGFGVWTISFFRLEYRGGAVRRWQSGRDVFVEYDTPYGTLRQRNELSDELRDTEVTGAPVEHLFKGPEDYDALRYIVEHTAVVENHDAYAQIVREIGEDGIALPWAGYLPLHQILLQYMGYDRFYYEIHDNTAKVETLHEAVRAQMRQVVRLAAQCPADIVEVGGNYHEQMTPPRLFEEYLLPFYREAAPTMKAGGKLMAMHCDGEMRRLLALLPRTGADVAEAMTPAPMTSIDVRSTRRLWGDQLAFWGGVASIMLTPSFSNDEFEAHLQGLRDAVAPGDRFILGFGDNAPTDAIYERIVRTARFAHGWTM